MLVLHGPATSLLHRGRSARGNHVPNARIQEISAVGHALPLTHPGALAEALTTFFSQAQEPI
jgi:pimeloyl-ACP methyl ester carboxylesterase